MSKIIERNTTIPVRRSQVFSTAEDNQPAVDIHVLQGERELARDNRSLGQFKLDGIPMAPRGVPQIEVTFDIDANGILKVSAKDQATGKEQTITISGSTSLEQGEIDRMVREAEMYAAEDKQRKQEVEVRNQADALAYQVERQLRDLGDQAPAHEKARIEQLLGDLQAALKENAPIDRIKSLHSDLQQAAYSISQAAYRHEDDTGQQTAGGYGGGFNPGTVHRDDDVVDADFEVR